LARTISIANQKGGVGKTTTAINLGGALAELGHRVLCVDMDPQAHATLALGIDPDALEENPTLEDVSDYTSDSGEGRWTVEEAVELSVPMPVISSALFARFASRQKTSPTMQAVAALRGQFGGHQVMTVAEGEKLRDEAEAGVKSADAAQRKAARKEKPPSRKAAAAKAKKATTAGPASPDGKG